MKRIISFIVTVLVVTGLMAATSPGLLKDVRLGLDLKGGFEILYEAEPLMEGQKVTPEALKETAKSLQKRLDSVGGKEPEITPEGTNRIRLKVAGVTDEKEVREMMKEPANLTFRSNDGCKEGEEFCKIELRGNDFVENGASVGYNELNKPIIDIKIKNKDKFAEITERLLGKQLAIFMDDELLSAPVVRAVMTDGNAQISGDYSIEEAKKIRDTINLGALPLKLKEIHTQSVGATLGMESLTKTLQAGLVASALILLFMIFMYRIPGFLASFALIVHTWLLILIFVWADFTLTLPGIAAFILGIGMAVDANIITYERIKEEMRSGKSIASSVKAGGKSSFRTIMDSNITTIIVAAVMFAYGTGSVKGFAIVLILEIIVSIATNVYFSRFLLDLLVKMGWASKPKHFGVKESDIRAL